MRLIINITAILMLIFGCGENREQNQEMQSSVKMSGHFSIEGMMCEVGCASKIKKELDSTQNN